MKLKGDFIIMEVGGDYIGVPTDETATGFKGIVQLNETAKDICEGLAGGLNREQLANKLLKTYDGIDMESAFAAIDKIITKLEEKGLVEQ